ncbi:chemotaxis protein methyltransferase WspC [Fluviicoccus keumensis]|uniref:Chemotaxis protein methyltransferase WspC n=1 Tax=Fluviicoccus keumensis TaxID=1435465 RepID=A0A4Q7ZAU1_9GAMM|nr:protein-glutamate O-methyltransferase CheR [Fluviicoccus keumensis]RZU47688.1 chemotaxis protein methyltransferase WspC [Fluviicoccus keumensis]
MNVDARITGFLKQQIGLEAASIGASAIERALRQRHAATALTGESYGRRLQDSGEERQALIEAVVVPETWFFRYPESFTALAGLARTQQAVLGRPLRLLSAPCASGEEPYSIAMALLDAGLAPSQFTIDAVDISPQLLARAETGCYGRNSFRGDVESFRSRYFQEGPDGFHLLPQVRERVRFRPANLMQAETLAADVPYDFVFCRNVLIYFDVPTQEAVLRTLITLLHHNGSLFVGPAEASLLSRQGLQPLGVPLSFAFRLPPDRPAAKAADPVPKPQRTRPSIAAPSLRPVVTPLKRPTVAPVTAVAPAEDALARIAALANAGQIKEALAACRAQLERQGPGAAIFYWFGLLHDTAGRQAEAMTYYRKALYLDPRHPETLAHLSALLASQGDAAGARRLQQRAARGGNS